MKKTVQPIVTRLEPLVSHLAREPLAQFFAIGLVLFAADRLTQADAADPRHIVLDEAGYGEIVDIFAEAQGRAPSAEEMAPLAERWLMNETLYREARALGLEEGDEMVRERIMQKLRVLMYGAITVGDPDEAALRAWFAENAHRYAQPARMTFRLARLDGDAEQAQALAARLAAVFRGERPLAPGEATIYPFPNRPRPALEQVFGAGFVEAVAALPERVWTPVKSPEGWQVVYLEEITPEVTATFEEVRESAAADWRQDELKRAARAAIEALQASYRVEQGPYDPAAFEARAQRVAETAFMP